MYKRALAVVSKAAYKTLKRGKSSLLGEPPLVSVPFSTNVHFQSWRCTCLRNCEAACTHPPPTC